VFNRARPTAAQRAEVPLGEGRTLNAHLTTIPGVGRAVVLQDITHLKELDRIKSEFVSTVSHDLRSPLTAILGYVDLLARVGPLNETQGEFVRRVQHSVHQITDLIGDLLDLGRIEAGLDKELSTCHFAAITRDALEGLRPKAEGKQQALAVNIAAGLMPIRGNELRLKQVVSNLSRTPSSTRPPASTRVEVRDEDSRTIFHVTDDGRHSWSISRKCSIAIAAGRGGQRDPGTGLGLAIVKSIERHRGRIWCESPVNNHGTIFTVVLPKNIE
jgi:two-component system NtrC family sensor kinase